MDNTDESDGEIVELSVDKGLAIEGLTEWLGKYVRVDDYKRLRVVSASDVILQISMEWSHNGREPIPGIRTIMQTWRTPSDMYKKEDVPIVLPYVRMRILNSSGKFIGASFVCTSLGMSINTGPGLPVSAI